MNLDTDPAAAWNPAARRPQIGLRIAAFLASLLLAFTGILHGAMAIVAYMGGEFVGAVGHGAEKVSAESATDAEPDSLAAAAAPQLDDVAKSAKSFALRAKLLALAIGLIAAAQLLGGELVRRRYRTVATPIALGVAVVGEAAMAIVLSPSLLLGMGVVACLCGLAVWWRIPRDQPASAFA